MKKTAFTIIFQLMIVVFTFGQPYCYYTIDFEGGHPPGDSLEVINHLSIDTISNPNNIWQMGKPNKQIFHSALTLPNAIVTDTVNSYPVNDTSSFIIHFIIQTTPSIPASLLIGFYYFINSDTLTDYGLIEFSPNNGQTWIDLQHDSTYFNYIADMNGTLFSTGFAEIPELSGNSSGWNYCGFRLADLGQLFNVQMGDTVLWKFSFISDNQQTNKDGLMIDEIYIENCYPIGLSDISGFDIKNKPYPNPTTDYLNIELESDQFDTYDVLIKDSYGKTVQLNKKFAQQRMTINLTDLSSGLYYYKITNKSGDRTYSGKIVLDK
jgi:hypothetical protein